MRPSIALDLVGSFADRSGQVLDGSFGVGDVEFVASAAEGPVVFGEGVEGALESVAGLVELRRRPIGARRWAQLEISRKRVEVVAELGRGWR